MEVEGSAMELYIKPRHTHICTRAPTHLSLRYEILIYSVPMCTLAKTYARRQ
jgi:hypothetical protein